MKRDEGSFIKLCVSALYVLCASARTFNIAEAQKAYRQADVSTQIKGHNHLAVAHVELRSNKCRSSPSDSVEQFNL